MIPLASSETFSASNMTSVAFSSIVGDLIGNVAALTGSPSSVTALAVQSTWTLSWGNTSG